MRKKRNLKRVTFNCKENLADKIEEYAEVSENTNTKVIEDALLHFFCSITKEEYESYSRGIL